MMRARAKVWGDAFPSESGHVILRLYLHRETYTPEPAMKPDRADPACGVRCLIKSLFAEPARAIESESACGVQ